MVYLLDDFTDANVVARRWRVFSDRVMGGVSNARADLQVVAGRSALRLSGRVTLERNGGFIQVARSLEGERFDAAKFDGIQLAVCGTPGSYFVAARGTLTAARYRETMPR